MRIIHDRAELTKLLTKSRDLYLPDKDVRIEFSVTYGEIRNITCRDLNCLDLNCGDLNCGDVDCLNVNCRVVNCRDVNCGDLDCLDVNCRDVDCYGDVNCLDLICADLNCEDLSYNAICVAYENITCKTWKKRHDKGLDPVCLGGKLTIRGEG